MNKTGKTENAKDLTTLYIFGFGFASGLWFKSGIDPETEIYKALFSIFDTLKFNNPGIEILRIFCLYILPWIVTAWMIKNAYDKGGWLACVAILLAFVGGFLYTYPTACVIFLIGGAAIGVYAFSNNR